MQKYRYLGSFIIWTHIAHCLLNNYLSILYLSVCLSICQLIHITAVYVYASENSIFMPPQQTTRIGGDYVLLYTVSHKNVPLDIYRQLWEMLTDFKNFFHCSPQHLQQDLCHTSHCTFNVSLHYLVKYKRPTIAVFVMYLTQYHRFASKY